MKRERKIDVDALNTDMEFKKIKRDSRETTNNKKNFLRALFMTKIVVYFMKTADLMGFSSIFETYLISLSVILVLHILKHEFQL